MLFLLNCSILTGHTNPFAKCINRYRKVDKLKNDMFVDFLSVYITKTKYFFSKKSYCNNKKLKKN